MPIAALLRGHSTRTGRVTRKIAALGLWSAALTTTACTADGTLAAAPPPHRPVEEHTFAGRAGDAPTVASLQRCDDGDTLPQLLLDGISLQLIETLLCDTPGALVAYTPCQQPGCLWARSPHPLWGQPALVDALTAVASAADDYLSVRALYLDLVSHDLLRWKKEHCASALVAPRIAESPLLSGLAVDVPFYASWRSNMLSAGFHHDALRSPSLFEWQGGTGGATAWDDLHARSIEAFQRLWNLNNPADTIPEDGAYGPMTAARIAASPVVGFPIGGCDVEGPEDPQPPAGGDDDGEVGDDDDGGANGGGEAGGDVGGATGGDGGAGEPRDGEEEGGASNASNTDDPAPWGLETGTRTCASSAGSPGSIYVWLAFAAGLLGRRYRCARAAFSCRAN